MEDFVIMTTNNFNHAQNYMNWKDMKSFIFFWFNLFCFFFPLMHIYNSHYSKWPLDEEKKKQRALSAFLFLN